MKKHIQKTRNLKRDDRSTTAAGKPKLATPRFDVDKLGMHYCSAAQAERIARNCVLEDLKIRAKAAGKKFNERGRIGPEICEIRWLFPELAKVKNEFAALIDKDLEKLKEPGAKREELIGKIYSHILCIRATQTILFGWEDAA